MFTAVIPNTIWSFERPIKFGGVWLRTRTTVVRLSNGGLWVHSPAEPTAAMCEALDELGAVSWLVVPNRFHHLHVASTAKAYPNARVIGPESQTRNPDVVVGSSIASDVVDAIPEFMPIPLAGVPLLDETVFYHRDSGSLIGADIVLCACARDHWSWRFAARLCGCFDKVKVPPDVRIRARKREDTARALDRMLALPLERLLVAHADPIDESPAEKLAKAWRFTLNASKTGK